MRVRNSKPGFPGVLGSCLAGLLVLSAGPALKAIYVRVETQRVPVGRLVENLEKQLAGDPKNPQLHINLARLHGMAWALKSEEVPAAPGRKSNELEPWYGHHPDLVPYADDVKSGSPEAQDVSRRHLEASLEHYKAALRLDPDNLLANLGYGWTAEQAGNKTDAVERYRRVIALAWPAEKQARGAGVGKRFFTYEAAGYLIPLLDPKTNAGEIKELQSMQDHFDRLPRAITPIAVPLRSRVAASQMHDATAHVRFDADGSGLRRDWTWIGRDAGWLVHDADGRGEISSALQLFGNVTFWLFWDNGYEALAALDDNADGELTGTELRDIAIWADANRNGVSEHGEVQPLESYGIAAISCDYELVDDADFAAVSRAGVRFTTGETRPTYDIILQSGERGDPSR